MPALPLVKHPISSLWEKSKDVGDPTSKKTKKLVTDMYATMLDADGIGIAAPQVGVNIRLFLVRTDDKKGYRVFLNPKLSRYSLRKVSFEEGCLSVPGHFGQVKRSRAVTIRYTNEDGEQKKERVKGLFARVVQHEYDHIQGVLFIKRTKKVDPPLHHPIPR